MRFATYYIVLCLCRESESAFDLELHPDLLTLSFFTLCVPLDDTATSLLAPASFFAELKSWGLYGCIRRTRGILGWEWRRVSVDSSWEGYCHVISEPRLILALHRLRHVVS